MQHFDHAQGRKWLPNTGRANSNVARRRRRTAASSILPKTGWAIAHPDHPPLTPLNALNSCVSLSFFASEDLRIYVTERSDIRPNLKTYSKRNVQPYFDATIDHILVHFKGSKGLHMHQNFVMELFEFH